MEFGFVSQCLYEGFDNPGEYYEDWHYRNKRGKYDASRSWRLTNPLYSFLCKPDISYEQIRINKDTDIKKLLGERSIQLGDGVFFTKESNGNKFYHVAIVSSTNDNDILYIGNTDDCFNKPISSFFVNKPLHEVVILCMRDQG